MYYRWQLKAYRLKGDKNSVTMSDLASVQDLRRIHAKHIMSETRETQ